MATPFRTQRLIYSGYTKPTQRNEIISEYERMAKELEADIDFAHPYSVWEKGIHENANGLIRQYFPKGTSFNLVTQEQIDFVMNRLNSCPRKTRGVKQPSELFLGKSVDLLSA